MVDTYYPLVPPQVASVVTCLVPVEAGAEDERVAVPIVEDAVPAPPAVRYQLA